MKRKLFSFARRVKKLRPGDILVVLRIRGDVVELARLPRRLSLKRAAEKHKKSGGRKPLIQMQRVDLLKKSLPAAERKRA